MSQFISTFSLSIDCSHNLALTAVAMVRYNWLDGGPIGSGAGSVSIERRASSPGRSGLRRRSSAGSPTASLAENTRLPTTRELAAALGDQPGHGSGGLSAPAGERPRRGPRGQRHGRSRRGSAGRRRFRLEDLLSRRVGGAVRGARLPCSGAARRRFLAPGARRAVLSRSRSSRARSRTRGAGGGTSGSTLRPLGLEELRGEISRRLARERRRALARRDPRRQRRAAGPRPALPHVHRSRTTSSRSESPTYSGALALARLAGVVGAAPAHGRGGPGSAPARSRRAKLVYLMPERQNPTGVTTTEERREAVLEAALASGALVIEDGYEEPESGRLPLAARAARADGLARHAVEGPRSGVPDRLDRGGAARSSSGWRASRRPPTSRRPCRCRPRWPRSCAPAPTARRGASRAEEVALRAAAAARPLSRAPAGGVLVGRRGLESALLAPPAGGRLRPPRGRSGGGAGRRGRAGAGLRPGGRGPRRTCACPSRASSGATSSGGSRCSAEAVLRSAVEVRRGDRGAGGVRRESCAMSRRDARRREEGAMRRERSGSRSDWRKCSRAASSWTSSTPTRRRSPRPRARPPSWRSSACRPDIRRDGGVARMSPVSKIREIQEAVSIPVMAKCRIGHLAEARVLRGAQGRLHRRVGGPDAGRRGKPRLQARFHGPVRLRLPQPRRGAAPHRRGRRDDPDERGGGHGRHRPRRQAPARGPPGDARCSRSSPRTS